MKKKPKRLLFFTKELKKIGTTGHFERNFCGSKNSSKIRIQSSNPVHYSTDTTKKSERQDLNLRPPPPQGGTLPSCATSRLVIQLLTPCGLLSKLLPIDVLLVRVERVFA